MKLNDLKNLFIGNDTNKLEFTGKCWDCGDEVTVKASTDGENITIEGGAVYKKDDRFRVKCDKCYAEKPGIDQECDVYSRVVGYLTSTKGWNKGKKEEFKLRKMFDSAFVG